MEKGWDDKAIVAMNCHYTIEVQMVILSLNLNKSTDMLVGRYVSE